MEICIHFGGQTHCFFIPILQVPINWGRPGPGPVNYPALFQDAFIVASVKNMVQHVSDDKVRQSLESAISAGQQAMQQRAGSDVTIREAAAR